MSAWLNQCGKNLRRNPILSAFMVAGLALSVGFYVIGSGARATFHGATIPDAERMFRVELHHTHAVPESLRAQSLWAFVERENLLLPAPDAITLYELPRPHAKAMCMTGQVALISPEQSLDLDAHFVTSTLFSLFDLRVQRGRTWTEAEEAAGAKVVVLDPELAEAWFGGQDPLGKVIDLGGQALTVIGVLERNRHQIELWELAWTYKPGAFVPFPLAQLIQPFPRYAVISDRPPLRFEDALRGDTAAVNLWVRLDDEEDRAAITRAMEAQRGDRLAVLRTAQDWSDHSSLPNGGFVIFELLSAIGLLVSTFGLSRLLVARFASRTSEIGLRCALGASRGSLFLAHITEAMSIGLVGGLLGIGVGAVGLEFVNVLLPTVPVHFSIDVVRAAVAPLVAVLASAVAAVGPSLRFARITPAEALRQL
ncbi:MAG: ABC transporter permease [Myxococcota bacterium]